MQVNEMAHKIAKWSNGGRFSGKVDILLLMENILKCDLRKKRIEID